MWKLNTKKQHRCFYLTLFIFAIGYTMLHPISVQAAKADYHYFVTDFGADGNDTKADTAALQEALDKASEDYTIEVIVPPGTYYISNPLYIQSNTILTLKKDAIIKRNKKGLNDDMLECSDKNHVTKKKKKYSLAHDITIQGGTWDGGNIDKAKSNSDLIYLGHSERITIKNTTVKNCFATHAIEFAGCRDCVVRGCTITGFRYDTDYFTSEAIQLDVCYKDDTYGYWAPGYAADKTPCKNILIEKNTIIDYPRGVGVHHSLKNKYCSDITIRKNKFLRSSPDQQSKCSSAVFLMGAQDATVTDNMVDHYYYGALVKSSQNITIKNNSFSHTGVCGILKDGCDENNGTRKFTLTNKKLKKKLTFTCPYIEKGTATTLGVEYSFKNDTTGKSYIKLKKKPKKGQEIEFYGVDYWGNKYYQTCYVK